MAARSKDGGMQQPQTLAILSKSLPPIHEPLHKLVTDHVLSCTHPLLTRLRLKAPEVPEVVVEGIDEYPYPAPRHMRQSAGVFRSHIPSVRALRVSSSHIIGEHIMPHAPKSI